MKPFSIVLLVFVLLGCSKDKGKDKEEDFLFTTVDSEVSRLNFTNELTETNALSILYYVYFYNGGGVAIGDINNDQLPDIYFTGNQTPNKLFLNKGNLKFEDITQSAGVAGSSDWNTGVSMADINGDGLLDIYTCAVVGINGLQGKNELFINNGDNTFTERGEEYGLDIQNYSTTAAFFDYDNDADLDMYLLNQAIHTVHSYGPANIRNTRSAESGDKLFRNDHGKFVDVSEEAGIFGGANGYGLGLATADFNNDGYTDIYVSNDFHENDLYYINNGDGTFRERIKEKFGHVSRFSMGSDIADVNHDGYMDILTLDMLPEKEEVLKASMINDPVDLNNLKIDRLGYHHQYTRNMLQINQGGEYFQETGLYSGLAATDWSWGPLFADYDLDGHQDIFVATGIPRRPNNLDYIKYISSNQIQQKFNTTKLLDQEALDVMPSGEIHNYMFKGEEKLDFSDQSGKWLSKETIISTGAAWGDLDNDGDIDLITNNINHPATLYQNNSDGNSSYLKIRLDYTSPNTSGIGTKIISYHDGSIQTKQLFTSRGFQSSSQPIVHFGYGDAQKIDSLLIIWPDNTFEKKYDVNLDQSLVLSPAEERPTVDYTKIFPQPTPWFQKVDSIPGIKYEHQENKYIDFNQQKLIPYQISDRGPAVAVGDLNGDGKDDIFFGNSISKPAEIYFQEDEAFVLKNFPGLTNDSISEDVSSVIADFNNDGRNDLYVVSAGGEFNGQNRALLDRVYLNCPEGLKKQQLPEIFENGSVVKAADYNKDGFMDLFVGAAAVSNDFGNIPNSYLLLNKNGKFQIQKNKELQNIGMITDAVWTDFNTDSWVDLIVVGEWMSPQFFQNEDGKLKKVTATYLEQELNGLWQSIAPFDINADGNMDFLLGNWGLNTKFSASEEFPLKMYYDDFDENGSTETIVAYAKDKKYYTVAGLDKLVGQLSYLRKRFPAYEEFAGKDIGQILGSEKLEKAGVLEVNALASGYLQNTNGKFIFKPFGAALQVAPITEFLKADFNHDGVEEVLTGGNYFGTTPYHGRFDGLAGNILGQGGKIMEGLELGLNFTQKAVVGLDLVVIGDNKYVMVTFNNEKPGFYKILE